MADAIRSPFVPVSTTAETGSTWALRAGRIARIGALHRVVGQRQIASTARERAEVIEARYERKTAAAAEAAVCRLEPEHAAERRRHTDRSVGVRAERDRHHPARDGAAGSAGRAAAHPRRVVRIARRAVVAVLAREVVGVLAHVQGADQNGARIFQLGDQRGVGVRRRPRAVDLATPRSSAIPRCRTGS